MASKELHDVDMFIHVDTAKAVLASLDANKKTAVWLPKSQIELADTKMKGVKTVTMPVWLAEEKKLV